MKVEEIIGGLMKDRNKQKGWRYEFMSLAEEVQSTNNCVKFKTFESKIKAWFRMVFIPVFETGLL